MTENSSQNDFSINYSESQELRSSFENRRNNEKTAYEKMFKEALANGCLDETYFEEHQKLETMLEKASDITAEADIKALKESFTSVHNSRENIDILEKKYSNFMNLAAECGTIKELYENELNKIAVIAKHLPAEVYKAKKETLEKAYLNAADAAASNNIFNLKNCTIAVIFIIFSFFIYAKTKKYIDFHTLSAAEKALIEERRKAIYSKGHDADFQNHLMLRKKTGRDIKQNESEDNQRYINTIKNQLDKSEREARAEEARKNYLMFHRKQSSAKK